MIEKIRFIDGRGFSPYQNIALEAYLLDFVEPNECIMYLWQNENTVVIGRNQNCFKECNIELLHANGGLLARRLSGGGAVYHDLGNLNFTFLTNKKNSDVSKQLDVIFEAAKKFGVSVEKTGRNDLTVDGKKISGNAFYSTVNNTYHHGTILVNIDIEKLVRYLTVSDDKIVAKGITSIRSRVVNLVELNSQITVSDMRDKMLEAFSDVYCLKPDVIDYDSLDLVKIESLKDKFASDDWRLNKQSNFTWKFEHRFGWGGISIELNVDNGKIKEALVFSDALDVNMILSLPDALRGLDFSEDSIKKGIKSIDCSDGEESQMQEDILYALK